MTAMDDAEICSLRHYFRWCGVQSGAARSNVARVGLPAPSQISRLTFAGETGLAPRQVFVASGSKAGVIAVKRKDTKRCEVVLSGETLC